MGPDVFFIRPSANKDRPPAVWWKDPNKQEDETTVYSGCYGKAILNCFAWHNDKSGDGVSFGIQGWQKHSEGERLGGAGPIDKEKWSETIADEGEAPAETAGGKGAGGLFGDPDSRRRVAACREGGRARENLPAGAAATIERSP